VAGWGVGGGVISAVWLLHSLRYLTVTARSPGHCQQTGMERSDMRVDSAAGRKKGGKGPYNR